MHAPRTQKRRFRMISHPEPALADDSIGVKRFYAPRALNFFISRALRREALFL
jgi:hypothetical protein